MSVAEAERRGLISRKSIVETIKSRNAEARAAEKARRSEARRAGVVVEEADDE